MKKIAINIFVFVFAVVFMAVGANSVIAAPRLTLTPVSGTYTNGSSFTVVIGVNSETEKSSAVDVVATFDASKLEVVEIVKADNTPYPFDMTPRIDNVAGKFDVSCASTNMNSYDDVPINGDLLVVTFKAKATGTANLNFTCSAGSTVDSNIFNSDIVDVINCGSNNSGSYTITAGSGETTGAATPTPVIAASTTEATTNELPQTGGIASTVGLIVFGAISLASALFLKFL